METKWSLITTVVYINSVEKGKLAKRIASNVIHL